MRELLASLMAEETFQPFTFVMNNGSRYEVLSFEMAVHKEDTITVFRPRSNARDVCDLMPLHRLKYLINFKAMRLGFGLTTTMTGQI